MKNEYAPIMSMKEVPDLLVTMVAEELSAKLEEDSAKVLTEFIASETGKLLYDETSKLWWNGPSYIADMYLKEKNNVISDIYH